MQTPKPHRTEVQVFAPQAGTQYRALLRLLPNAKQQAYALVVTNDGAVLQLSARAIARSEFRRRGRPRQPGCAEQLSHRKSGGENHALPRRCSPSRQSKRTHTLGTTVRVFLLLRLNPAGLQLLMLFELRLRFAAGVAD